MSVDTVFKPIGSTTLVGITAVQLTTSGNSSGAPMSIRCRNLQTTPEYFTWGNSAAVTSLIPAAGVPAPNTIGMLPTSVETFEIPYNSWVIASLAASFEMTPGQGP